MVEVLVQPIYGWGWNGPDGRVEVPGDFRIETSRVKVDGPVARRIIGQIVQAGHDLNGLYVNLAIRTVGEDAHNFNLALYTDRDLVETTAPVMSGYAQLSVQQVRSLLTAMGSSEQS